MTVIAWDGKTLAADRLMLSGDTRQYTTKIQRHGGHLLGTPGTLTVGQEMAHWWKDGAEPSKYPASNRNPNEGASLIVVHPGGRVFKYESSPFAFEVDATQCAFGSGDAVALAVMALGYTAFQAVQSANLFVSTCGGAVDSLELAAE